MAPASIFGILLHWIGGLAAASFYIPYKQVRRWSWETYWLVGGVFSWLIMPSLMASLLVPGATDILRAAPGHVLFYAYFFGALWGVGGLTFGLTMRYLGIALGMAVALGYTAVFGTIIPPLFHGMLGQTLSSASGKYVLIGVLASVAGIAVSGMAGMSKERELTGEQKQSAITEFQFGKGMIIATFSGIMSSCFAFGLDAGAPIAEAAKASLLAHGGSDIWQGLPVLIIVLLGGFTTNFVWCLGLNVRNKSAGEYMGRSASPGAAIPLARNYLFAAVAGIIWYLQFFFYTMGQAKMGKTFAFSNWTLHMASIMIFSMLWGIALKEWTGTSKRTHGLIALGLALLIGSTIIIGYGNYLDGLKAH
ncbi:sugar:proton symporter [Capsulimonas corticalis]|uniref:Sugar:proton symporter n=1 Tax=Capsulimonas corticalis TaxID=2219043 RepID=A0A402CQ34_9BACT|nr:L-rhamnose/proton symporter RhaT [Capsulimonas corticalis]BDI32854.1 sugar:proton symporter [Capsulimonas corticalis]